MQCSFRVSRGYALQLLNFFLATAIIVVTTVEFALPPPVYDSFPTDRRYNDLPSIDYVFEAVSPWGASAAGIHRVMDSPILLSICLYYFGCFYFRFRSLSWVMTAAAYFAVLTYCIVHYGADDYFEWKYLSPRIAGIALQITGMAALSSIVMTLIQAKRKRFKFRLRSQRDGTVAAVSGNALLAWNLTCNFALHFICLTMWTAGSYQSFVFIRWRDEMSYLCQMSSSVICVQCPHSTKTAFTLCATNSSRVGCNEKNWQAGFCIFNVSVGYFTFIRLFSYTGGLFFFLGNFINAMSHYLWISIDLIMQWLRMGEERTHTYVSSVLHSLSSARGGRNAPLRESTSGSSSSMDELLAIDDVECESRDGSPTSRRYSQRSQRLVNPSDIGSPVSRHFSQCLNGINPDDL